MTKRKPRNLDNNIKCVCIWSKENARNSIYDSKNTNMGFTKIEYMLTGQRVYVHVIAGMNPLFEDVLGILLKDSSVQKALKGFHGANHYEEGRNSYFRIRIETGMLGCQYVYEDWAIQDTCLTGIPRVSSDLLFTISSMGKIEDLAISVASLYRFLLYKKELLEQEFPGYECKYTRKNVARSLRKAGTRIKYCHSPAKQFFDEIKTYSYVYENTYKSLW